MTAKRYGSDPEVQTAAKRVRAGENYPCEHCAHPHHPNDLTWHESTQQFRCYGCFDNKADFANGPTLYDTPFGNYSRYL